MKPRSVSMPDGEKPEPADKSASFGPVVPPDILGNVLGEIFDRIAVGERE